MPIASRIPGHADTILSSCRTVSELPVQWGDQDAFGHVNNVVYFRWFETARIDLLASFSSDVSMSGRGLGPILASIQCDYRKQLHFPDIVYIGSFVSKVGRSSFNINHVVYSEQQQTVVAEGSSVAVVFDYEANRPARIPDTLRAQLLPTDESAGTACS